jgi:uncharacterized protein
MLALAAVFAGCSGGGGAPSADEPPPRPAVFVIAGDDGAARGWLVGTIHALPSGIRWRSPVIRDVTAAADSLLVEVADLDDPRAIRTLFSTLATTPGLPPLAARIPQAHHARLAGLVRKAGLDEAQQRRTESWAAAVMLSRLSAQGSPENGVDRALIRDFSGRRVRELEGARNQFAIFDGLPEDAQRALLVAVIEASDPAHGEAERLRHAWLEGDLGAIESASERGMLADPRLREALLVSRNRRWLGVIEAELQSPGRPLIAVGGAHLVGPEGLITLLEERGWQIARLK